MSDKDILGSFDDPSGSQDIKYGFYDESTNTFYEIDL